MTIGWRHLHTASYFDFRLRQLPINEPLSSCCRSTRHMLSWNSRSRATPEIVIFPGFILCWPKEGITSDTEELSASSSQYRSQTSGGRNPPTASSRNKTQLNHTPSMSNSQNLHLENHPTILPEHQKATSASATACASMTPSKI
jgi:hypothetical protein